VSAGDLTYDNCPTVSNADQANSDEDRVALAAYGRPFDDVTWPMSDLAGDACDDDADNDGLSNADELTPGSACPSATAPTDPVRADSDGDGVLDGAECLLGSDPVSASSLPPRQPLGDSDRDGLRDDVEETLGTDPHDADTDNDTVLDGVEVKGFNTSPLVRDSDSDGCEDRREIASVNADYNVNIIDVAQVVLAVGLPSSPSYVPPFDLNRDNAINVIDLQFGAKQMGMCAP
jgi:hypothetical protein